MTTAARHQHHPHQPAQRRGRAGATARGWREALGEERQAAREGSEGGCSLVDLRAELRVVGAVLWRGRPALTEVGELRAEHLADSACSLVAEALLDGAVDEADPERREELVGDYLRRIERWAGDQSHAPGVSWADIGQLLLASMDDGPGLDVDGDHLRALAAGRAALGEVGAVLRWMAAGNAAAIRLAGRRMTDLAAAVEVVEDRRDELRVRWSALPARVRDAARGRAAEVAADLDHLESFLEQLEAGRIVVPATELDPEHRPTRSELRSRATAMVADEPAAPPPAGGDGGQS